MLYTENLGLFLLLIIAMKKGISFIFTLSVEQKPVLFFSIRTR